MKMIDKEKFTNGGGMDTVTCNISNWYITCSVFCLHLEILGGNTWMWCIQFHWQLLIINSCFGLVNILLLKMILHQKKEIKMIKAQMFWKITKKRQKVCVNIKQHSLFWIRPTETWCNMLQILGIGRKHKW